MAAIKSNHDQVFQALRSDAIRALDRAGQEGRIEAERLTPRDTGFAADSVHYVVLDENGQVVAGQQEDGNDNLVPSYDANGMLQVVIGSNTEPNPKTGRPYYSYIEQGTYGLSGAAAISQGLDVVEVVAERELKQ